MARVDDSAPNDQFITEGGRRAGPNETPVLEARVPGTDHVVQQHPHNELGTGAQLKTSDGKVISGQEAYDKGQGMKQDLQGTAQTAAQTGDVQGAAGDLQGPAGDLRNQAQG